MTIPTSFSSIYIFLSMKNLDISYSFNTYEYGIGILFWFTSSLDNANPTNDLNVSDMNRDPNNFTQGLRAEIHSSFDGQRQVIGAMQYRYHWKPYLTI